jgi:hypothetical protein
MYDAGADAIPYNNKEYQNYFNYKLMSKDRQHYEERFADTQYSQCK